MGPNLERENYDLRSMNYLLKKEIESLKGETYYCTNCIKLQSKIEKLQENINQIFTTLKED